MRSRVGWAAVIAVALGTSGFAGEAQPRKPRLEVRARHGMSFGPTPVVGEDLEEFYCVGLRWDWGDGVRSYHESDCEPFEAGMEIARFFSARHVYAGPGMYRVRVSLVRADREVAVAGSSIHILGQVASSSW
jgi:hypothetical protein